MRRFLGICAIWLGLIASAFAGTAIGPVMSDYFWHPELAPVGPLVMVVSIDEQVLYVYRNGVAIAASPVSSGRPGYETPTGVYTILQKEREHRSNLYDDAPMPYMQRLTWDGVAMHGGQLPGHPASHGCIRLPPAFAEKLFAITRRGSVVVVADHRVAPATVTHPAAIAPIDLSGRAIEFPVQSQRPLPTLMPGEPTTPLSVIASLRDHAVYVLRDGELLGSAPLDVPEQPPPLGTLLYVMEAPRPGATLATWSAFRILGTGPVPAPGSLAGQLRLPPAFGQALQALLVPGTTVLVTDLPGIGGDGGEPYARLLEAQVRAR